LNGLMIEMMYFIALPLSGQPVRMLLPVSCERTGCALGLLSEWRGRKKGPKPCGSGPSSRVFAGGTSDGGVGGEERRKPRPAKLFDQL